MLGIEQPNGKAASVSKKIVHLFVSKLCLRQAQQYLVPLWATMVATGSMNLLEPSHSTKTTNTLMLADCFSMMGHKRQHTNEHMAYVVSLTTVSAATH